MTRVCPYCDGEVLEPPGLLDQEKRAVCSECGRHLSEKECIVDNFRIPESRLSVKASGLTSCSQQYLDTNQSGPNRRYCSETRNHVWAGRDRRNPLTKDQEKEKKVPYTPLHHLREEI